MLTAAIATYRTSEGHDRTSVYRARLEHLVLQIRFSQDIYRKLTLNTYVTKVRSVYHGKEELCIPISILNYFPWLGYASGVSLLYRKLFSKIRLSYSNNNNYRQITLITKK